MMMMMMIIIITVIAVQQILVQKFGSLAFKLQKKSANSNIPIHEV
jgi:hypothetical protein